MKTLRRTTKGDYKDYVENRRIRCTSVVFEALKSLLGQCSTVVKVGKKSRVYKGEPISTGDWQVGIRCLKKNKVIEAYGKGYYKIKVKNL